MIGKLKRYAPHLVCVGVGVALGLALATTTAGAKVSAKLGQLRAKAGI